MKIKWFLIRGLTLLLALILVTSMLSNCINVSKNPANNENPILFFFIIGIILGLIIRVGITLLFWYSYNARYPNEKYNEKIMKKVFASLIFVNLVTIVFLSSGMLVIFSISTLMLIIRKENRIEKEQNDENRIGSCNYMEQ